MKIILFTGFIIILSFAIVYSIFAFILAEIDFVLWTADIRFCMIASSIILDIFSLMYLEKLLKGK